MTKRTRLTVGILFLLVFVGFLYLLSWEYHAWKHLDTWWVDPTLAVTIMFLLCAVAAGFYHIVTFDAEMPADSSVDSIGPK